MAPNNKAAGRPRTWLVADGPFADAFHVVQRGNTVRVVNAPTVADLSDVRPRIAVGDGTDN